MAQALVNGDYLIDVILTGGSGKASILSPAKLNVTDGEMIAEIEWSSPYYDYMEVEGEEYFPVNSSGNSRFVVDIPALDTDIPIKAETTAMSEPHMIEYMLFFDSTSASGASGVRSNTVEIASIGTLVVLLVIAAVMRKRDSNGKK